MLKVKGVFLKDGDIEILKSSESTLVHCPASNAKLGVGIAPVTDMANSNCSLALGTDGAASNNTSDLLREARLMCLFQKALKRDASLFPASQALRIATGQNSHFPGIGKMGMISEGYLADLVIMGFQPVKPFHEERLSSELVHHLSGKYVDTVIVEGNPIYARGVFADSTLMSIWKKKTNITESIITNVITST